MIEKKYIRLKTNVKQPHSSFVFSLHIINQRFVSAHENLKTILSSFNRINFGIVAFNKAEKYNLLFIYSYLSKKNPS